MERNCSKLEREREREDRTLKGRMDKDSLGESVGGGQE